MDIGKMFTVQRVLIGVIIAMVAIYLVAHVGILRERILGLPPSD